MWWLRAYSVVRTVQVWGRHDSRPKFLTKSLVSTPLTFTKMRDFYLIDSHYYLHSYHHSL
jgi:transcriptional regulator of nitric oxide reductase